jgi:fermentation-respiration switch protein FrsA (DUF1100 family)
MKKFIKGFALTCAVLLVGGYAGVVGWYKMNESKFIYYPNKRLASIPDNEVAKYQFVEVTSTDSVKLVCLMSRTPVKDSSAFWVLFFHGNSGNVLGSLARPKMLDSLGVNVFSVDYRGYGGSSGTPSEVGLYEDADACYHYVARVLNVRPERIVIYGYSLGSGVATELATRVKAAGLILEGAFESLAKVGQKDYPYLPLSLMMGQTFSSIDRIDKITIPILMIHGRDDRVVPFSEGRALYEKATGPKRFLELSGGHNSAVKNRDTVLVVISEFLSHLGGK